MQTMEPLFLFSPSLSHFEFCKNLILTSPDAIFLIFSIDSLRKWSNRRAVNLFNGKDKKAFNGWEDKPCLLPSQPGLAFGVPALPYPCFRHETERHLPAGPSLKTVNHVQPVPWKRPSLGEGGVYASPHLLIPTDIPTHPWGHWPLSGPILVSTVQGEVLPAGQGRRGQLPQQRLSMDSEFSHVMVKKSY